MEENKDMFSEFLTEEHKELIRKGITKAIKEFDFYVAFDDFMNSEFDYVQESCSTVDGIRELVTEVMREHLEKSGLLKPRK